MKNTVGISLSNRHCHLSLADKEALFGKGYEFKVRNELSQPGQYAYEECVNLKGPKGIIEKVRVLGPERKETQIEVLRADCFKLGIAPVMRDSGDLKGTPGLEVIGPNGSIMLEQGVIVALRHIHISLAQAEEYGLCDGQRVSVKVPGEREIIFGNVLVRAGGSGQIDFHVDIEEGNAAGAANGLICEIIK
ncbi:MAG: phosphate propanoyltransferase [Eubacteriaceae bacterium]|nr:phosphate propanoyltransferase [Eubacteriaceae bacterium]